jgi:aspartyl-tRNA(Asn)/glutamyl-tRNA(Gln) amidotransferase subunit A
LHGVPIGIKDIIDVADWPTRAGSPTRTNHVASSDAELVRRLRKAGAIILGKTVTTEFACFDPARTRNPWNTERSPGGSSSGSAAAVALQMCMAAIGTQTGGSIIRPASYCGVCGLKPGLGLVPMDGIVPVSDHLDHAGPIARTVGDAADVFFSLVDYGLYDRESFDSAKTAEAPMEFRPIEGFFKDRSSSGVYRCFQEALTRIGAVRPILDLLPLPDSFVQLHDRHWRIMASDAANVHRTTFAEQADDFGPNITTLIKAGLGVNPHDYDEALEQQASFRKDMVHLLGETALALTPSTTSAAPLMETTGDPAFNSPWSYAGMPAITVPCGTNKEGLPCGLQIVGPPGSDSRILSAARFCEQVLGFNLKPHCAR